MIIADVIDRIAARLRTIDGLNVLTGHVGSVRPPAAIVGVPKTTYDLTYQRGSDSMELGIVVLLPNPKDSATWTKLSEYADGSGARSVKVAVQTAVDGEVEAFDEANVKESDFDEWELSKVPYAACVFVVEIIGRGTT